MQLFTGCSGDESLTLGTPRRVPRTEKGIRKERSVIGLHLRTEIKDNYPAVQSLASGLHHCYFSLVIITKQYIQTFIKKNKYLLLKEQFQ